MAAISFVPLTPILTSQPKTPSSIPKLSTNTSTMMMTLKKKMKKKRGELLVSNAGGPPSSTSLILAFILPLSLFAGTVFASIRVADDLDRKFLDDLAAHKASMEENEDEDDEAEFGGSVGGVMEEEEVVVPAAAAATAPAARTRNRPKREG